MLATRKPGDRAFFTELGAANRIGVMLRNLLALGGPRLCPPEMALGVVQPTIDIGQGGYEHGEYLPLSSPATPINGVASADYAVLTSGDAFDSTFAQWSNRRRALRDDLSEFVGSPKEWGTKIGALTQTITFDAAGALAFNGKFLNVNLFLEMQQAVLGAGAATRAALYQGRRMFTVATAVTSYTWNINNGTFPAANAPQGVPGCLWTRWVPPRWNLILQIVSEDGTVFPANTTQNIQGTAYQRPAGGELPL